MLPPLCFNMEMELARYERCLVFITLSFQTSDLHFYLVRTITFSHNPLANFTFAVICFIIRSGFCQATLPYGSLIGVLQRWLSYLAGSHSTGRELWSSVWVDIGFLIGSFLDSYLVRLKTQLKQESWRFQTWFMSRSQPMHNSIFVYGVFLICDQSLSFAKSLPVI